MTPPVLPPRIPPLGEVLAATVAAVQAEGRLLLAEFYLPAGPRGTGSKAPIDAEIEVRLREALQRALPCTFIGEETGETRGALEGWCWIVDPHDGTTNFLKGTRGSSISVGLVRGAVPVLGVVHAPASADRGWETFAWAEGTGPLRRNGQPVQCDLRGGSLAVGAIVFATTTSALRPVIFSRAIAPSRYVALASVAHRMARVAAGDGVATLSIHHVNEYDIAAGAALLRASGGVVIDFSGREVVFTGKPDSIVNGCFAGAPQAAAELARFDWSSVRAEEKRALRVAGGFPKVADKQRLARATGCLLGQAVGDSLGSLGEFESAAHIARAHPHGARELAGGGTWNAGRPTGGAELALALARSILAAGRYDAKAALTAYRAWFASAPFDVGAGIAAALEGTPNPESQGNGSLMRASPIGIWAAGDSARAAAAAREDSALTHPHPVCADACAACAAAISAGVAGGSRDAMLAAALAHAASAADGTRATSPARAAIERAAAGEPVRDFASSQGRVLIALQNAFFQLMHARDFEEALVAGASAGGDTNAAIAGALAGAALGIEAIPPRWVLPVLACRPLAEAGAPRPRPMHYWPDDVLEVAEALLLRSGAALLKP